MTDESHSDAPWSNNWLDRAEVLKAILDALPAMRMVHVRYHTTSGAVSSFDLTADMRKWLTGSHKVVESIKIPADFAPGDYELLLNLPDEYASLANKPEYSIRLANTDLWDPATGFNKLNHTLKVN